LALIKGTEPGDEIGSDGCVVRRFGTISGVEVGSNIWLPGGVNMPFDNPDASRVSAADYAHSAVAAARDDPTARLALLRRLYEVPRGVDRGYLPYRRAASEFMAWQLRRGLLNSQHASRLGSPWWRAVNETLLRDTAEARALAFGPA
jgi:hypothetical protein